MNNNKMQITNYMKKQFLESQSPHTFQIPIKINDIHASFK